MVAPAPARSPTAKGLSPRDARLVVAASVLIVLVVGIGVATLSAARTAQQAERARSDAEVQRILAEAEQASRDLGATMSGHPPPQWQRPKPACAPEDFAVNKVTYESSYGSIKMRGVVRHSCATAAGVQLKWTAFNKDGTIAFSSDFWPASTVNIQPNTAYPFATSTAGSGQIVRYEVTPIAVNVW